MSKTYRLADLIIGTWRLLSISGTGYTAERLGEHPVGVLTYDSAGNVSAQIMREGRALFSNSDMQHANSHEVTEAFRGYVAYFGTYEINEEQSIVYHHVTGNLFPNDVGTTFQRKVHFSGQHLVIQALGMFAGEPLELTLTWTRIDAPHQGNSHA